MRQLKRLAAAFALAALVSSRALPLRITYAFDLPTLLPFMGYVVYPLIRDVFFNAALVPGCNSVILANVGVR